MSSQNQCGLVAHEAYIFVGDKYRLSVHGAFYTVLNDDEVVRAATLEFRSSYL